MNIEEAKNLIAKLDEACKEIERLKQILLEIGLEIDNQLK